MKSRTSLNIGQIGSVTSELHALEGELNFPWTYYGISKFEILQMFSAWNKDVDVVLV